VRSGAASGAPERPSKLEIKGSGASVLLVGGESHSSSRQTVVTKRVKRVNGYFTNRRQLPPRYPGGSAERRVCLEGTKKDSSASRASSRSGADGGPTTRTQLAPYSSQSVLKGPRLKEMLLTPAAGSTCPATTRFLFDVPRGQLVGVSDQ
jgi:hypothetical protein